MKIFGDIFHTVYRWLFMFTFIPLLLPAAVLWSSGYSQSDPTNPKSIAAVRLEEGERINLDGLMDETAWLRATPAVGFLQKNPDEGKPATEQTEVSVLYDTDYLYFGMMLYDSEPDRIIAYQKQRDASIHTDDRMLWMLYTFQDGRTGYFFEINPAGVMGDGLFIAGSSSFFPVNKSWDGIWDARITKRSDGWSAEVRIPFRTLNFDPSRDTWGINFSRTIVRKNEESLWSGNQRNQGLYRIVHAGQLTGLRGMSQGRGLEVKPFSVAGWRNMPQESDPTSIPSDVGFDLTYSVTPSLRAALTVNTDFAEVEVDQRRVNLTRFPLRYPERRDFFLEGSSIFSFSESLSIDPYFSRRIGMVGGEPIPITYGVRVAGQARRYALGLIQVQTGKYGDTPADNFTVARVKRSMFLQSSVGVIYTRRATGSTPESPAPPDRYTQGIDLDLNTSRFLGDKNLGLQAYLVWHTDPVRNSGVSFRDLSSHGIMLNYPNDLCSGNISYQEFGEDYSPAIGFTSRNGYRKMSPVIQFAPRPESIPAIRQLSFVLDMQYLTDLANRIQTREFDLELLGIRFESGDNISVSTTHLFERLEDEFTIHEDDILGDVVIPVGDYTTSSWTLSGRSASQRPVAGYIRLNGGQFWSGHRSGYSLGLTLRPYPGVALVGSYEQNNVQLPEGDFSTRLFRLVEEWHITPRVSVNGSLQYDDVSEIVGLYAKFRWIIRPGSDLYLVYTHNWLNDEEGSQRFNLITRSQGATTKINYTLRF
ncbi:DUF5916 domain-containing protein [Candidatus Neomarinimicrobiota bacterium]